MFTRPQRAEDHHPFFHLDPGRTYGRLHFWSSTSSSGLYQHEVFGDDRSMNAAVRTDPHLAGGDQASFHRNPAFENHVFIAFDAAVNARAGADPQGASDYQVAAKDLSCRNLKITVMQQTLRTSRFWNSRVLSQRHRVVSRLPDLNPGSVQALETAISLQMNSAVRRDTPIKFATLIRPELADRVNPAHYAALITQVNFFLSQDGPVSVLSASDE